jgi:hypothetical protein
MTYAKVRKELLDNEEFPPLADVSRNVLKGPPITFYSDTFECFCPETIDCEEFNLILVAKLGGIYLGRSIDFDFSEEG